MLNVNGKKNIDRVAEGSPDVDGRDQTAPGMDRVPASTLWGCAAHTGRLRSRLVRLRRRVRNPPGS